MNYAMGSVRHELTPIVKKHLANIDKIGKEHLEDKETENCKFHDPTLQGKIGVKSMYFINLLYSQT